jgi:N-acetylglucosamine-6-sulfatase
MRLRALALVLTLCLVLLASPAAGQSESALPTARLEASAVPGSPSPGSADPATPEVAPDIILVMVDDLGYLPADQVLERLPSVRELWLDGGLRFTEMHDQSPLCGPSRVSMLTGKDTLHHGVTKNFMHGLDDTETIAVALDEAGYHTAMIGRYLNRYDGRDVPPGWDHAFMQRDSDRASFWDDGEPVRFRGGERDEVIRKEAARAIREAPLDEPLFAWISPGSPHVSDDDEGGQAGGQAYEPEVLPRDEGARACRRVGAFDPPTYTTRTNRREARDMPDWPRGWRLQQICESMLVVDRTVRQVVAAQARRDRPAYFIFMSDNGMSWGQKGFSLKHTPSATRAPFYVAGPGIAPGSTDALASKIDIGPTIAELAGTTVPWADGQSLVPVLAGAGAGAAEGLGRGEHLEVMPGSSGYKGWNGLRTPERHFVRWDDGHRELYDLAVDPWQRRNLVSEQPDVATAMEARLDELLAASAAEGAAAAEGPAASSSPQAPEDDG